MGKGTLNQELEEMMGILPTENDTSVGEGSDVSKEVDANGQPINQPESNEPRVEGDVVMSAKLEVFENVPFLPFDPQQGTPYCPVFVSKRTDGKPGRLFEAYITGTICDVDRYIDLIDTLLTASKDDLYYIYEDSPGGYVSSGGIIASAIHHSQAEVHTVARGICASAAALIHSAAPKGQQQADQMAILMYHMSSHSAMPDFSTKIAKEAEDQVRYVNECLLNKAVEDGHITEEEFKQIQNGKEIFVTGQQFNERVKPAGGEA